MTGDGSTVATQRDCLLGYDWCDGPDGETVDGEAFGGLCSDCRIKQLREKLRENGGVQG